MHSPPKCKFIFAWALSAGFALLTGCISQRATGVSDSRPPDHNIPPVPAFSDAVDNPLSPEASPRESLTLRQALVLALMKNPELEAFSHNVRAAEARTLQADLLHNPEIEFELESFDRDGEGYDSAEPSVMLGQVIELGGKRHWRVRAAEAAGELAGWHYESKRLDIFTKTAQRFTDVIAAQQRLELAKSSMALAEQTCRTVDERVKAGKTSPIQKTKAAAELEMARLDTAEAANTLMVSRHTLAAVWGSGEPHFQQVAGNLDNIPAALPAIDVLRLQLASNPDLARAETEVRVRQAAVDSEKAARIPDIKIAAGIKRFEEDDTHAFIFGIGAPLPLFDRNQGNITAAKHEFSKALAKQRATSIELSTQLTVTHAGLTSAHKRVQLLRSKVIPAMKSAFNAAHKGYKEGKFGFLDVLDAQRTLFSTENELIDALADYHTALNDIERLTGMNSEDRIQNSGVRMREKAQT